ncbi:MAG: hypothetical protein ABSA53_20740 [Streptosporangiaceae bacterium]|jgi:hypothetical protein
MATFYPRESEEPASTVRALPGVMASEGPGGPPVGFPPSRGNTEAGFLSGPGKSLWRRVTELLSRRRAALARERKSGETAGRARRAADQRKHGHQGGNRSWLLRLVIPLGLAAEAVTAYVGMEVLVASASLAAGLSVLTALVGTGMACALANRRLNGLGVPVTVRILEGLFVAVLTVLRYESLSVQGAGYPTAIGAAALAALISALALVGIEEVIVETHTFSIFISLVRASWASWRWTSDAAGLAATEAAAQAAADKLRRHYLDYLLRTEGLPLEEAQGRAAALKAALISGEGLA